MIKILSQINDNITPLQCASCHSNNNVKIIILQYDRFSKSMFPLCEDCQKHLIKLLKGDN